MDDQRARTSCPSRLTSPIARTCPRRKAKRAHGSQCLSHLFHLPRWGRVRPWFALDPPQQGFPPDHGSSPRMARMHGCGPQPVSGRASLPANIVSPSLCPVTRSPPPPERWGGALVVRGTRRWATAGGRRRLFPCAGGCRSRRGCRGRTRRPPPSQPLCALFFFSLGSGGVCRGVAVVGRPQEATAASPCRDGRPCGVRVSGL